jgi:hypothetical protein
MPYATFAQVADYAMGVARLRDMLDGHAADLAAADNEPHPFFDTQVEIADREIDAALRAAGYATPLDTPYDPLVTKISAALTIEHLTKGMDNRVAFIEGFASWAKDELAFIADGTRVIVGAVEAPEPFDDAQTEGIMADVPLFDRIDPRAGVSNVFPTLDRWRVRGKWE